MKFLGTAKFLGKHENNSKAWHELRATGIGGSDVAGIVGVSPWSSPFKIWAVKTGKLPDESNQTESMEWGSLLEPVILSKFKSQHPDLKVWASPGTWAHRERAWQLANPDGLYKTLDGKWGLIEIKTARYEDDWVNGVPAYYQAQVQWYCSVFGLTAPIYVAVLFGGSKYREFVVEPDAFVQGVYLAEVEKFIDLITADVAPEFDGSMATLQTVRELNPDIDDQAEVELGGLAAMYLTAQEDVESAEKAFNLVKARVLNEMGLAKKGLFEGKWILTRQSRNGGTPFLVQKRG